MIAGKHVIVVASGVIERAELERFGALVLETRDATLLVRHLHHALTVPWPAAQACLPDAPEVEPPEEDFTDCPEPILCTRCRAEATITAGKGPHVARARCVCGAWRWIGRAELARAGIDPANLTPAVSAQLDMGAR